MEAQTVIEGNRLIAEFMEIEKCSDPKHADNPCYFINDTYRVAAYLEYHTSWDWLMPVYKKIITVWNEHYCAKRNDVSKAATMAFRLIQNKICHSDIDEAVIAVFDFIKLHNTTKNKTP